MESLTTLLEASDRKAWHKQEETQKIGVFLVDNSVLFRQGVRLALWEEENIKVLGECDVSGQSLSMIEAYSPDVVLLEVDSNLSDGFHLASRIAQRLPTTSVIGLSSYPDGSHLFPAIKAGMAAYLSRDVSPESLAKVIRRVFKGDYPISENILAKPEVASKLLNQFETYAVNGEEMETLAAPLTPREIQILSYVAAGNGNKQIAYDLKISEQTVKNHLTSILRKLAANDRTHAVVLAMRHGFISIK